MHTSHSMRTHTLTMVAFVALLSGTGAFVSPNRGGLFGQHDAVRSSPTSAAGSSTRSRSGVSYRPARCLQAPMMASRGGATMGNKRMVFGGGCFWCIEAVYRTLDGVSKVTSGYAGGTMDNPTYRDVCSGRSGHAEVVMVEYDPKVVTLEELLDVFWKSHDPTQGNRQGLDMGTQYRSIILCEDEEQLEVARASKEARQAKINKEAVLGKVIGAVLGKKGENVVDITTTVDLLPVFWEAEKVHQNYYAKNPLSPYCVMNIGTKLVKVGPDINRINGLTRERERQSLSS